MTMHIANNPDRDAISWLLANQVPVRRVAEWFNYSEFAMHRFLKSIPAAQLESLRQPGLNIVHLAKNYALAAAAIASALNKRQPKESK
jgi:hypothetical protein